MDEEKRLISLLAADDSDALGEIMDRFAGYAAAVIKNFSRGLLSDEDIDEICADIFYKLWEKRKSVSPENGLRPYLSAMARNAVKNRFRSAKPPKDDISRLDISDGVLIEEKAEINEMINCLKSGLKSVSNDDRTVFMRFYFYGEKTAEIAKAMKLSEGSVRSKLSRTREKLRNYLLERGFDYV